VKLHQMRFLCETAAHNFNLSEVGRVLHTSQSVVSRQIQQLEAELGFDVLLRRGKRIVGLSSEGEAVLAIARRMTKESDDLKKLVESRPKPSQPRVTIATTHFHARYTLLKPIIEFRKSHPEVHLKLTQSHPRDIERLIAAEEADFGLSMQTQNEYPEVLSVPYKSVPRILITPVGHPLLKGGMLRMERLVRYPLIIYDESFSGGKNVTQAFRDSGLRPNVVLTAMDADVIKAYVAADLGVAVVQSAVFNARTDSGLRAIDASHLFPPLRIAVLLRTKRHLNQALIDFISRVIPELDITKLGSATRPGRGTTHI
jgi:LysR family cys regulon transcriptional activator